MPNNLDSKINDIITAAAQEIASAVRRNIAEEVGRLVGAPAAKPAAPGRKEKPGPKPGPTPKAKRPGPKPGRKPQPKKAAASIDQVLAYVKANPGQRTETISKAIGADAKPALAKLREQKEVKTKGERRATTYSVG